VRLVNLILLQANKDRASDIHFESYEDKFAVRYRVDGILYEMEPPPRRLGPAILSRIKIMARMDIAEKRLPQDGRIELRVQGESIDLRVSTIPTVTGEHCVIRILRRNDALISLDHLELTKDLLGTLKSWAQSPNGLVVISGPAGSGKTTVLYALLNWINRPNRRIITVEDPVEYRLPGISQMQVNTQLGLNASRSIESALRQDPDVLALTLIDDVDTLTSACKAVLTGHLVLANLMASSATGAIARMLNLGCEPSILAGSLQGISCQRLVRRLCECKRQVALKDLTPLERKVLGSHVQGPYFVAQGCEKCHQIGYRGRVAIFEMVPITEDLRGAILKRRPERRLEKLLARHGARSLWDDGLDKAAAGITSVAEVLHVTGGPHLTEETA
jgi:general secretion pathway protein E